MVGTRLIRFSYDRAILHKYKKLFDGCNINNGDSDLGADFVNPDCIDICKEFNVNKMTYLIDGEARFIHDFMYVLHKNRGEEGENLTYKSML